MATTYPSGSSSSTTDSSAITTLVGILALIAIVALVYFIFAGGRESTSPTVGGAPNRAGQTTDNVPPAGNPPAGAPGAGRAP